MASRPGWAQLTPPTPGFTVFLAQLGSRALRAFDVSLLLLFLVKNNCFDAVNRQSIHMAHVPRAVKGFCPIPTTLFAFLWQPVSHVSCLSVLPEVLSAYSSRMPFVPERHTLHTVLHVAVFTRQCDGGAHSVSGRRRFSVFGAPP